MEEKIFRKFVLSQTDNFELYTILSKILTIQQKKEIVEEHNKKDIDNNQMTFDFSTN